MSDESNHAHAGAATEERKPNRLIESTSPYLLQHAYNPVDWHEWNADTLAEAKRHDKPIFLSVGYSTCHWCHVMEHESFERDDVAALLNDLFIPIKVDREERPDIDEQYMLATQLSTRRGGWPNSVVLTPDGRPWFAGTYFPRPQFMQMLIQLGQAWRERRDEVEQQADRFAQAIREAGAASHATTAQPLSLAALHRGVSYFESAYDERNGGFGGAPKFPPHGALAMLLQQQRMQPDDKRLAIINHTLDAIERGGIHDHVGGGFHRYATDSRWFLPHFEKMLYDNAQLMQAYTQAFTITNEPRYRQVVARVFAWLKREMIDQQSGIYSALDADSEGEEGKYYVWTIAELADVLGPDDAEIFAAVYGTTEQGNYMDEATRERTGANVLYLPESIEAAAQTLNVDATELNDRLTAMREKLLHRREQRIRPHLDDKVLSGWNGLMFGALAQAGRTFNEPAYIEAAKAAADFVLGHMRTDGRLHRSWRNGKTTGVGYLDDYAYVASGLLDIYKANEDPHYLQAARALIVTMIEDFHDPAAGGFYFTSGSHESLLLRAKELGGGGNMPSGNGVAASAMIRLAINTGEKRYAELAADTLNAFAGMMWSNPHGSESLLVALGEYVQAAEHHQLPPLVQELQSDADVALRRGPLRVEAYLSHDTVTPGQQLHAAIRLTLDDGLHVYANPTGSSGLTPTEITIEPPRVATLSNVAYPEPQQLTDPILNEPMHVYQGSVTILASLHVVDDAPQGDADIRLNVKCQACDDQACLEPELIRLELPITVAADTADQQFRHANIFRPLGVTEL
ncbi:MAG: DUF255 domain-containing protein [Phycisphaeraceae bacterium]